MTPKTFQDHKSSNIMRTWLLMILFAGMVVGLGYLLAITMGNISILYGAIGISLLMNIFSYWFSAKIALSVSKAKPADEATYSSLHTTVERLAQAANIPKPRVYITPDKAPNAFATGRNKHNAAIAVTQGLLDILTPDELEGVLAHELGHVKNYDILISTMAVVLAGSIALLADFLTRSFLMQKNGGEGKGVNPVVAVIALAVGLAAPLAATMMRTAVSRRREYLADATGASLTHQPHALASALEKISGSKIPMEHAHTATAHLFISNPFKKSLGKVPGISRFVSSHPPAQDRIERLRSMGF